MRHTRQNARFRAITITAAVAAALLAPGASKAAPRMCDPASTPTVYLVNYAHLDTQWRWSYRGSIDNYIADTMFDNFRNFSKYPNYRFNFTGSLRYAMMKEYYPKDYEKVKEHIAAGRWFVSGSSVDETDVNAPSPESLTRNILYGNLFFKNEFGKISEDYMLPDCFGFPASMPSVLAHAGLKGFSTQKLTWGSAVGIPFNVGKWIGPDGRHIIAALNPGAYVSSLREDLSKSNDWLERARKNGEKTGFAADFKYVGVGDRGGAVDEESASWINKSVEGDGPLCVKAQASDDIFKDMKPEHIAKLPTFKGDMLLTEHSAGSITSQAYMKRWNRKNELLADGAERASLIADWLGSIKYPTLRLRGVWHKILGLQMHDILPGTAIPEAYEYSWNDAVIGLNTSASILTAAAGPAAMMLDTEVQGEPVIVFNPLSAEREDLVRAKVGFGASVPAAARVFGPDGAEVPSQIVGRSGAEIEVMFLAKVPSVGYAVFDVRAAEAPSAIQTGLSVTNNTLENKRFKATLDSNGDVASLFDKANGREVLSAPARLEMMEDTPREWPAWNIDWSDWSKPPKDAVKGPAEIKIIETGPARVALEVTRHHGFSTFKQVISLAAGGSGDKLEFDTTLDWREKETTLKAAFPLTAARDSASYNLKLGVVDRANNNEKKYEVPHHEWFDLTDASGDYGMAVLEDSKYASDKPADNVIRLTLVRTPGCFSYCDQATQDMGRHRLLYAMAPHKGGWREGGVHWQAARLNEPLLAFTSGKRTGALGRSFSFMNVGSSQVIVRALKMAEESDRIIVRLQELDGKLAQGVAVSFAAPIIDAMEVDGQEREIGAAKVANGALTVDMEPFIMRTFAVKIGASRSTAPQPKSVPLDLPLNFAAATKDGEKNDSGFDGSGLSYSADMLPGELNVDGVSFKMEAGGAGKMNAVACEGQSIALPKGKYDKVYILAAATEDGVTGAFKAGASSVSVGVQKWNGFIGQWDNRIWKNDREIYGLKPAFIKRDPVAWFASHLHNRDGSNVSYNFTYIYKYAINLNADSVALQLPNDPRIKIFAATAVEGVSDVASPAFPLYDVFEPPQEDYPALSPAPGEHKDTVFVHINHPWYSQYDTLRFSVGGDVTENSQTFRSPIMVTDRATVYARSYGKDGKTSKVARGEYVVNDVTPPGVKSVEAFDLAPAALVRFTEPVEKKSAETASNYSLESGLTVTAASLSEDALSATLTLSAPPAVNTNYILKAVSIKDRSPNANVIKEPVSFKFATISPAYYLKIRTKDISYSLGVPGISRDYSLAGSPMAAGGIFGLALRLKGEGDYIVINDRAELNPSEAVTVAAWVNPRDWDSDRIILQKSGGDGQYRLGARGGKLSFAISGVGEAGGALPAPKEWSHVAATYDGWTMRLFVNGNLVDEKPAVGAVPFNGGPLYIGSKGKDSALGDFFKGEMDKVTVWGAALPAEHIARLAAKE